MSKVQDVIAPDGLPIRYIQSDEPTLWLGLDRVGLRETQGDGPVSLQFEALVDEFDV